ncbi:MAG: succinate-semialdehyde dehydrogenase / glutarate-semialdehyde dehydrogenase [Chthoniobacter sp.]|nr:succinate-semialdehyde dehydrogenase / glutarate-semialdehyde dehydrogenase [Chthoniobacter sp.]
MNHFDLLIDNQAVPASDGARSEVRSPHDGRVVGTVAKGTLSDLDAAVSAAQVAFKSWSALTPYERERIIRKATAHARTKANEIGMLMALEQGKPLAQSVSEIGGSCDTIDYYAAEGVRIEGCTNATEDKSYRSWVAYQPVGVCGLITPWNYPVSLLSWKLGPALATGCTVVVKPTTVTPMSPLAFCQALVEGGLPAGVVNCLTGSGAILGDALVKHRGVAKVAMTGSSEVGKQILTAAGPMLKKVSLELGGQCPAVVCADADLKLAAKIIAYKGFRNCGQSCSGVNRVYVHASVHDPLVNELTRIAESLRLGDGITDPKVDGGPMATADGVQTCEAHVADALARGAKLVTGGQRPADECFAKGNYYLPTALTGCTQEMLVMREETFGPVVGIASFETLDEAIKKANDTDYGLVAYAFTRDYATTVKLTEALEAGTVCVNHGAVNTNYGPYSGWKDSGYGLELSRRAVFEYLKTKHIKTAVP